MFDAGMTGIRLNLSHSSLEGSHAWIHHYFDAAKQTDGKIKLIAEQKYHHSLGDAVLSVAEY